MSEDKSEIKTEAQSGGVNIGGQAHVEANEIIGGDKIEVGAGATNVAIKSRYVWQISVRIGPSVIPLWLLVSFVLVLMITAAVAWYLYVPAAFQPGQSGILIAEFGQEDAQGNIQSSEDGKRLSEWMYRRLQQELGSLPDGAGITVWQDSMTPLEKRTTIGIIRDAAAAEQIARTTHAHIVIYGNLKANQNPASFVPSFHVALFKGEADELVGSQTLGSPLTLQLPLDFGDPRVNTFLQDRLQPRTDALLWFATGLTQDLVGDYAKAYQTFKDAEKRFDGLDPQQGKQVLYYFIGREALAIDWHDDPAQIFPSSQAALDEAEKAFHTSLDADANYARAYFGLGQVALQRAQRLRLANASSPAEIKQQDDLIHQAITLYMQAIDLSAQSPGSQIEIKARASLGSCYFLLGQLGLQVNDPTKAIENFKQAGDQLTQVLPKLGPDEYRFLAQIYQVRGTVWYEFGHALLIQGDKDNARVQFQNAVADYQKCSQEADLFPYDSVLQSLRQDNCKPNEAMVQQALAGVK